MPWISKTNSAQQGSELYSFLRPDVSVTPLSERRHAWPFMGRAGMDTMHPPFYPKINFPSVGKLINYPRMLDTLADVLHTQFTPRDWFTFRTFHFCGCQLSHGKWLPHWHDLAAINHLPQRTFLCHLCHCLLQDDKKLLQAIFFPSAHDLSSFAG